MKAFTVAQLVSIAVASSGKSQKQIAADMGFDQPNVISLIKSGQTKLPINRVRAFAESVGIDAKRLMTCVLREYMPDTWVELQAIYGLSE